jgi:hypothetical protein
LLRLVLVAPETSEAHGGAEFERLCLLLARNANARPKYNSAFAASGSGDSNAILPVMRLTSASHILSPVVSTAIIASLMLRQESSNWPIDLVGSGEAQERGIVGETPNLAARIHLLR